MELLGLLVPLLVLLLVGTGLRARGYLDEGRTARLNAVAYYGALPALIFTSTYDQPIRALLSPSLFGGVFTVLLGMAALAGVVHRHRQPDSRRSVAIIQSYHSNIGYLGLPLVAVAFGAEVTAVASVILGIASLGQVFLTVLILSTINGADVVFRDQILELAENPVLAALALGIGVSVLGLSVPSPVASGLGYFGDLALPLALLCVGASLKTDLGEVDIGATGSVLALKNGCMPALAWVVFTVLAVDANALAAGVVMLGTPAAVSTYVFASELGGDENFASLNVFVTTIVSLGTLFILIELLG